MSEPQVTRPANAQAYFQLLHREVLEIKRRLSQIDPGPGDKAQDEPVLTLLESILGAIKDQQTSAEVMHQRLDAIARYVPGAARAVSGRS